MKLSFDKATVTAASSVVAVVISGIALVVSVWSLKNAQRVEIGNRQVTFALKNLERSNLYSQLLTADSNAIDEFNKIEREATAVGDRELAHKAQEYMVRFQAMQAQATDIINILKSIPEDDVTQRGLVALINSLSRITTREEIIGLTQSFSDLASEKLKADREAATKPH